MSDANISGDSDDLEALFDSIAAGASASAPSPAAAPAPAPATPTLMQQAREGGDTDDSDDLQALFDSIAAQAPAAASSAEPPAEAWEGQGKVFQRVGQMARQLHDTLAELGYDKLVEKTVSALPDAKDRLAYIANLTEQAACRVLNATDIANPLQDDIESGAAALAGKWDALFANQIGVEEFKQLAAETRAFLKQELPGKTGATKEQLLEIMMAQDFQDLTGQVIKKVIGVAQELESQLMGVLIETMPGECRTESVNSLLNGPVINAEGRTDVVGSQRQVDDLLDSLGF
ncbi:MAG: protein phosphatase CheZ [Candidatus Accumulibacter sp. 66-26]|nr:protein phosphatase CheZ [Accumulibacter sp.]OJW46863.1 MAG: protein phosphatase CheZ [Candidatus Accumulibacter sp. 66-26]